MRPGAPAPAGSGVPASAVWALAAGMLSFGLSPILVRFATDAPGLALADWRTVFAALILAPYALPKIGPEVRAFSRRDWALIGAAGVFVGLHFIAWIEALYWTSVASVSVLVTTSPLFIALLGFVFLRERLDRRTVAAILVAVAGAAMIGLGDPGGESFPRAWVGNVLALTAALLVAVYLLIGRAVRQRTSFLAYLFPLYTATALTCLAVALVRGVPLVQPWPILALCFAMGLISSVIGHGSINYAVKFFPAAVLGLLTLAEPIIASGIAFVLFAEVPGPVALVGMVVVLSSLVVVFLPRLRG